MKELSRCPARKQKFNMTVSRPSDFNIALRQRRDDSPSFYIISILHICIYVCVDTLASLSGLVNKVSGIREKVSNLSCCSSLTYVPNSWSCLNIQECIHKICFARLAQDKITRGEKVQQCFTLFNLTCKSAEIILRPRCARRAVYLIIIGRYYGVMREIRFV